MNRAESDRLRKLYFITNKSDVRIQGDHIRKGFVAGSGWILMRGKKRRIIQLLLSGNSSQTLDVANTYKGLP
jgi:hypothetical protein